MDVRWPPYIRYTPAFIISTSILSVILLVLSITHAVQVIHTKSSIFALEFGLQNAPSNSRVIFYTCTLPILSTLYAPLDCILYLRSPHSHLFDVTSSAVLAGGWLLQTIFWSLCDFSGGAPGRSGVCPQYNLRSDEGDDALLVNGLVVSMSVIGYLVFLLYVGYLNLAAMTFCKERRRLRGEKGDEEGKVDGNGSEMHGAVDVVQEENRGDMLRHGSAGGGDIGVAVGRRVPEMHDV